MPRMYARPVEGHLELEVGDWKESRMLVSFNFLVFLIQNLFKCCKFFIAISFLPACIYLDNFQFDHVVTNHLFCQHLINIRKQRYNEKAPEWNNHALPILNCFRYKNLANQLNIHGATSF